MKSQFAVSLLVATTSLAAAPAFAATALPALPAPYVFAVVEACTTTPCQADFSQRAAADNVPLSQFGKNYPVTNVNLNHNPTVYNTSQNTPGELTLGDVHSSQYSLATANGSPKVVASQSTLTSVGGLVTASELTYFFEVIDNAAPSQRAPVTVGVTATGGISGSTTSAPSTSISLNDANVTAQLTIVGVLNETAEAQYAYICLLQTNNCSQTSNFSTPNVTVHLGPTSTFSGGFHLKNAPYAIDTGQAYEVIMSSATSVDYFPGVATAFVDPMITVPDGYSLDLSPGISFGNSGVPEPATWASMLVGLGLVGGLARRRRALGAYRTA